MDKRMKIIVGLSLALIVSIIGLATATYMIYSQPTGNYTVATWTVTISGAPSPSTINQGSEVVLTATISGGTSSGTVTFQKSVNSGVWTDIGTGTISSNIASKTYTVTDSEGSVLRFKAGYQVP